METSVLRRFTATAEAATDTSVYRAFWVEPGQRRPEVALDIRLKTGDRKGVSYAYVVFCDYNPSDGITLECTGRRVLIQGRHLGKLYEELLAHQVRYVQEWGLAFDEVPEEEAKIDRIMVEEK